MRVVRIVSLLVLTGGALSVASAQGAQSQGTPTRRASLRAEAKISQDSARKIALAQVPNGKIRSHKLEPEKGTVVYSYDIAVPKKSGVEEVLVSAIDGSVVSVQHETAKQERAELKEEKQSKSRKP